MPKLKSSNQINISDPYIKMVAIFDGNVLSAFKKLTLEDMLDVAQNKIHSLQILLNFGFEFDGKTYIINGENIIGRHWTHSLGSVVGRAEEIPKLYLGFNNLMVDLNMFVEKLELARRLQLEKIWEEKDDPVSGMYQASVSRMNIYVGADDKIRLIDEKISELKGIAAKLKGILTALNMQNQALVAMIYHHKYSQHIFQDAIGSLMHNVKTTTNNYLDEEQT